MAAGNAALGPIVCDDATRAKALMAADYEELPMLTLKGKRARRPACCLPALA